MRYAETGFNLEVDLTRGNIERVATDPRDTELYLGGLGTNAKILWDRVPPETHPFDPDNLLIFSAGLLCGTPATGCNRTIVSTISPQTLLMAFSMMGGFWAPELKYAGYDKVILRGKSPDLVYLWINDDKVEIRDAAHLKGKGTVETAEIIRKELDQPKAQVAAIGLAGENRVYMASIDHNHASAARGAKVILAIGQKTPRWPECHIPDWATQLSDAEYQKALAKYMEATVNHYRNHGAMEIWQVENEPFLPFGGNTCRPFLDEQLKNEVLVVRSLDPTHQILVSDSGELSSWSRTAHAGDLFGTTLYRVVWSQFTSYWNYDWVPPLFYRGKLWLNHKDPASAFVLELQGEPWIPNNTVMDTAISEQYRSMDLARLEKNMNFAVRVGLPRTYLWGAEWWYWLKVKGSPEIYEFVRQLRKNE